MNNWRLCFILAGVSLNGYTVPGGNVVIVITLFMSALRYYEYYSVSFLFAQVLGASLCLSSSLRAILNLFIFAFTSSTRNTE